ncbi:hypothetical protein BD410DRAFT_813414 [Rickenella mellea]|uniref:HNH nuclease domain-containing protein n=1 Tax=Rickenella mellea TaxID=50990 RepID=A0A4Y7QDB0_9AGAM|nr:hypothetical protein BD410DRAFT_813414 [Rickenella mellea]
MAPLVMFPLPLPAVPPPGYGWAEREFSDLSTSTAFNAGIDERDTFLGKRACIVCGINSRPTLHRCHIIPEIEQDTCNPKHEPRDGMIMCSNHQNLFDVYCFFIRYIPNSRRFVFINYSDLPELLPFHDKAIALDINDRYAPFPSLFILHEMRVRGFYPFEPVAQAIPDDTPWQDLITSNGVFNINSGTFNRSSNRSNSIPTRPQLESNTMTVGNASSGTPLLPLNQDVIAEILAATHAMPSWKACQMEGTDWTGTAEENIQKYVSSIGMQDEFRIPGDREASP